MSQSDRTTELLNRLSRGANIGDRLGRGRVAVVISAEDSAQPQAQLLSTFLINLLARLNPVVHELDIFVPNDAQLRANIPRWQASTLKLS